MDRYRFSPTELSLMENSPIPLAVYQFIDKRVVTLALSAGFCKLFGYELEEAYYLMDNDMYRDTHPDDVARIGNAAFLFATQDEKYNVVYRTKCEHGYAIIHARGEHINTEDGTRIAVIHYTFEGHYTDEAYGSMDDLSPSFIAALHEQALYQRNYYDHLTGLPNMTYFFELAEAGRSKLHKRGVQTAILFFNLNGMKYYNHRRGFAEGDKLIKAVAEVLVSHFSNENCSRFGKDHFAVFTSAEDLEQTIEVVFAECKQINDGDSLPVRVGIYLDELGAVDIGSACDRAQYACNLNRKAYASEYRYFDEKMLIDAEERRYIVRNIDRAIKEGWIKVYYQAIVRTANGKVSDEEALARWVDPEKGFLSPAQFIPALEDAKLAYKLDLYVLNQVLQKMKRMADEGLHIVPQSINLSRTDFDSLDIVEEIRKRVDAAGIAHEKLTIEITESVVGSNFDFMKEQIERLRLLGFHVWMDDFGSGYSSLDVLQKVKVDVLKLDMRFLEDFENSNESKIIITELISMAIALGIDTVAEGVETKEQADFLREIGCTRLQGYYFTRPIPPETIVERNKTGAQIGFENPDESEYYAAIGRINLYDMAVIAQEDARSYHQYFDTNPMAIIELDENDCWVTRSNRAYREYIEHALNIKLAGHDYLLPIEGNERASLFLNIIRQCASDGNAIVFDEELSAGETSHVLVKRVAVNPVSGTAAVVVAVLASIENARKYTPVTFANIAKALSSDYAFLFYVDLETEEFVQFGSTNTGNDLSAESHGDHFFQSSREKALTLLHEQDRDAFIRLFTKENVVSAIDEQGSFITSYRQYIAGEARHLIMKAVRMSDEERFIIIGVNDIEDQTKEHETLRRMQRDHVAYRRIFALSDEYLAIYVVDLDTNEYEEFSSTGGYENMGFSKGGTHFFSKAREESSWALLADDQPRFVAAFTKENVVATITREGSFSIDYHLMMNGKPVAVSLKAVIVEEQDGKRLVIGVR